MNPTQFIMATDYKAFKNNGIYTGSFTISGSMPSGVVQRTYTLPLPKAPDMVDIQFSGVSMSGDPRPTDAWFSVGSVSVSGGGFTFPFYLQGRISGSNIVIMANSMNQSIDSYTLSARTVNVRVVDYSIQ